MPAVTDHGATIVSTPPTVHEVINPPWIFWTFVTTVSKSEETEYHVFVTDLPALPPDENTPPATTLLLTVAMPTTWRAVDCAFVPMPTLSPTMRMVSVCNLAPLLTEKAKAEIGALLVAYTKIWSSRAFV